MRRINHVFFVVTITIFSLPACSKKVIDIGPEQESIVLVPTNKNNGTLTALDGRTGAVKWEIGFLGNLVVQNKTLYMNQISATQINNWGDTSSLYSNTNRQKNILSVDASTGRILTSITNILKPNYMLGCCGTGQISRLVAIENGIAFMVLTPFDFGIVADASLYATDLHTGSVKWVYKLPSDKMVFSTDVNSISTIKVNDGKVFVSGATSSLVLDASTGKYIRDYPSGGLIKPMGEFLYSVLPNNKVVSMHSKSGVVNWEFKPNVTTGGDYMTEQPLVYKDMVYVCTYDGLVSALDLKTGIKKWEFKANYSSPYPHHSISILSEVLFLTSMDGKLYALDAYTGSVKWDVLMSDLDKNTPLQTATKNTFYYTKTQSGIVAVDIKNGQKVWQWHTPTSSVIEALHVYDKTQLNF